MATPKTYQCRFVDSDSVAEDFYCKLCDLVARKLTCTGCCGETYCYGCIRAVQQDNKPCPNCAQRTFEIFQQVKYQRKISALHVYCSLKERGCGWSGPLEHIEAHLDPDTGDCEYIDVACRLCGQNVGKKTLECHTAEECVQRDYICPYCAFKATYKIVTEIHWPECSYFPLACPNRCGLAFERTTLEDHLKMCPLEEVACQFEHVGCSGKFRRKEEEHHMRERSQTHLSMIAAAHALNLEKQEKRFEEQQRKFEEQAQKFERKFREQERSFKEQEIEFERRFEDQELKFKEQERKFKGQERRFEDQERKFEEQERKFEEQEQKFEERLYDQERKFEVQERKFEEQDRKFEEQKQKFKKRLDEQWRKFEKWFEEQERKFEEQERQFKKRLDEQERKLEEQERKFEKRFEEQERKFEKGLDEQERKFEKKLDEQERKFEEHKGKFKAQEKSIEGLRKTSEVHESKLEHQEKKSGETKQSLDRLARVDPSQHRFSFGLRTEGNRKSPALYTHVGGYKFCINNDFYNGDITLSLLIQPGDYDDVLKWPVTITVTLELINHLKDGQNRDVILKIEQAEPSVTTETWFGSRKSSHKPRCYREVTYNVEASEMRATGFVRDGSLHFVVTHIELKQD